MKLGLVIVLIFTEEKDLFNGFIKWHCNPQGLQQLSLPTKSDPHPPPPQKKSLKYD